MTTTQGEHAQTEALKHAEGLEWFAERAPGFGLDPLPLKNTAAFIRRLHAQVAALTAVQPVAQGGALGLLKFNDDMGASITGLPAMAIKPGDEFLIFPKPTAQPAPQGVAYAELPDMVHCDMQYAVDVLDAIANRQRIGDGVIEPVSDIRQASKLAKEGARRLHRAINAFDTRASNGQAPAGATIARVVLGADGKPASDVHLAVKGDELDVELFDATYPHRAPHRIANLVEHPTAQAAPAATDPAYSEACSLATALFEKHYRQEPDYASGRVVWSLCDTTAGVISQIDNMVSGLARAPAAGAVAGPSLQEIQWRNIRKVVDALADFCFGSQDDPRWGVAHVAIRTSLTAKDGLDVQALKLDPLAAPTPAAQADSQPAQVRDYPPLPPQDHYHQGRFSDPVKGWGETSMRAYVDADRAARAPADSVLEDAANYRWIRDGGDLDVILKTVKDPGKWETPYAVLLQGEELDAAIAAARKQGGA